jgi:hypothetical protein
MCKSIKITEDVLYAKPFVCRLLQTMKLQEGKSGQRQNTASLRHTAWPRKVG